MTVFESRISDWSSDVCSSDLSVVDRLVLVPEHLRAHRAEATRRQAELALELPERTVHRRPDPTGGGDGELRDVPVAPSTEEPDVERREREVRGRHADR